MIFGDFQSMCDQGDEPFFHWFLVKPSKTTCFWKKKLSKITKVKQTKFANFVLAFFIEKLQLKTAFTTLVFTKQKITL